MKPKKFDSAKITGEILSKIVLKFVESLGLNLQNIVSVSTDTAAIITGKRGGAIKYLKDTIPHLCRT